MVIFVPLEPRAWISSFLKVFIGFCESLGKHSTIIVVKLVNKIKKNLSQIESSQILIFVPSEPNLIL